MEKKTLMMIPVESFSPRLQRAKTVRNHRLNAEFEKSQNAWQAEHKLDNGYHFLRVTLIPLLRDMSMFVSSKSSRPPSPAFCCSRILASSSSNSFLSFSSHASLLSIHLSCTSLMSIFPMPSLTATCQTVSLAPSGPPNA